jgi:uncharacterized protein
MNIDQLLQRCSETAGFAGISVDSVQTRNVFGDSPLHVVASWGDAEGVRALLTAGAEVDALGERGRTPLFSAVGAGRDAVVKVLLAAGASTSVQDDDGRTPADLARILSKNQILARLLKAPPATPTQN